MAWLTEANGGRIGALWGRGFSPRSESPVEEGTADTGWLKLTGEKITMRVLMIDDNPLDIELVSRLLARRNSIVLESVHTAEEGLRRLRVEEFDVVLLDYCLPGQNGLEFLHVLQGQDNLTPVLLITARGDERIQEVARQAGAADYISKDDTFGPALPRAVEAAAERGRALRATRERDRAEEMRHSAERLICELEHKVEHLEAALGTPAISAQETHSPTLPRDVRNELIYTLTDRYEQLLRDWIGDGEAAQHARQEITGLVADLLRLGFDAEQLISLHTASLHRLRDHGADLHSRTSGCTPKTFLLHTSLALMDGYRRAAIATRA